jgi:hypothetical protein
MTRKQTLLMLCTTLALLAGVATTTASAGNPQDPSVCKKGGWQTLVKADGKAFKNEDACVRYILAGGPGTSATQLLCQSYSGTFATGTGGVLWTCNGWTNTGAPDYNNKFNALSTACHTGSGGTIFAITTLPPAIPGANNSTCFV